MRSSWLQQPVPVVTACIICGGAPAPDFRLCPRCKTAIERQLATTLRPLSHRKLPHA